MHPTYQLVEGDQVTGPHSLAVLRQKADIHVITPDTPARPVTHPAEPWRPLREQPELHDLLFTAKPAATLGATRFHSTNAQTDAETAPIDVQAILRGNLAAQTAPPPPPPQTTPDPYTRRRRAFTFITLFLTTPVAAACYFLFPRTTEVLTVATSITAAALFVIYWVMFHVLDPR